MARIAIVVGNSVPDSYCEALGEAYARGAAAGGHEAALLALTKLHFDPILREGYRREQVRLQHALDEALEDRRHVAAPQRKDEDEVIGGADRLTRLDEIGLERLLAAIALAQDRIEVQFGK